jgi:hypothetical protein
MPRPSGSAVFAGLALIALLGAAPAAARCPRMPDLAVRADVDQPKPALGTLPMAELRRMSRDGLGEHDQALGLYKSELRTGLRLQYSITAHGAQACLGLREAAIDATLVERKILLARELQPGTCRYDVTLAHEQRHARIDETVLGRELPKLKAAIAREAADIGSVGPVRERDIEAYRDDFGERLQRVFRREIERIAEIRRREQAQIDTPDAYKREAERCPGGLALD